MATSISRLNAQIAKLQKQADDLKQSALNRVQREIQQHGLTAEDIFGGGSSVGNGLTAVPAKKTKATSTSAPRASKYGDKAGNTWGGMGKRPQWLKDALEAGATLESFLLSAMATRAPKQKAAAAPAKPKVAGKTATKSASKSKTVAKKASTKSAAKPADKASATRKPNQKPRLKRAAAKPAEAAAE